MNRCLHLTIYENAATLPQRGAPADLYGQASSDPEANRLMAPVDDPRSSYFSGPVDDPEANRLMAPVDDPEANRLMAPVDDPHASPYLSGGSSGWGGVAATASSCCCASAGQDTAAPKKTTPHPFIRAQDYSGFVIVRMAEGVVSQESRAKNLWALAAEHQPPLKGLTTALELGIPAGQRGRKHWRLSDNPPAGAFVSRPLVELQDECGKPLLRCESLAALRDLEKSAATTAFRPLHSLADYWRLDLREHPDLVDEVVERLNGLAEVDLAYRELAATDPRVTAVASDQVFAEDQGYLADAPTGISASWAWKSLAAAKSPVPVTVTLCDLEQGWHPNHQDLRPHVRPDLVFGANRALAEVSSGDHGTAVLGQLAADGKNPFGIRGAAANIGQFVLASHYLGNAASHSFPETSGHVAPAIAQALRRPAPLLKHGDILLLEVQRGLLPAEVDESDFDAIRLATALGIIVIEAAGNGGFDLDGFINPVSGRSLRRDDSRFRDSGAILVGAAQAGLPHNRALFSNYGSRLNCFGWGESVTTCGYGNLAGTGDTDSYTNTFSGTSSASPIVAGAAALLQGLHQAYSGEKLEPQVVRTLLANPATGTRQGPNVSGHIGVMPDLRAIARDLLQLVPDVYMRRSLGDDGAAPVPNGEAGSCPDILVCPEGLSQARVRYGEGSRRENIPAPGALIRPGAPNNIYVRLRNRGLSTGDAQVQLFASPAATLITPERWIPIPGPIGGLAVSQIPQGDTSLVAGPFRWQPPPCPIDTWSFLAVLTPSGESPCGPLDPPWFDGASGLPPGPPYFDWAEYRAFLRRPEVAWRNTYRVTETALTFSITGTPDRAHSFDFEVIQRLPAGAKVTLQVNDALLAAKLRQRQPWLGGDAGRLDLPKRPRTMFQGVQLAACTREQATFRVHAGSSPLLANHSLAFRQLWHGEEVGRITWYFGPDA